MTAQALVIGTAGHIDHGKTSLVRALTGVDLDDLPEEKERGITIQLGFTRLDLPDGRRAAFVDVPGHEKLVRTMVSGATGIDAVLLCVSAVDGAMPQTREHLAILDLLGVRHGAVVLTMADLVDDELLELAVDDVRTAVAGTFLEGAPVLPFSSVTGHGRDALVAAIAAFPDTARPAVGPFRLPVDRVFVRSGFGVVVTGTAWSGALDDGSTVDLLPQRTTARVRGIEVHDRKVDRAVAGRRTALNLSGLEPDQVPRGTVVASGPVPCPSIVDVRYRHLAGAPDLEDGAAVRVLHGTTERGARLHLAQESDRLEPGRDAWVQLRLEAPLPCCAGDRLIVRRPSPAETLGGGTIVDPWAVKVRRRDRAAHARDLDRLASGDRLVWLERAGDLGLTRAEADERGLHDLGEALGDRLVAPAVAERLDAAIALALATFHRVSPLARGAQRRELRRDRLAHVPDRAFDALLERAVASGRAELDGPLVRERGFAVVLDPTQRAERDALLAALDVAALEGRSDKELAEVGPNVAALAHLLEDEGRIELVSGLGWVSTAALDGLRERIRGWFAANDVLTPQAFKELTGLTRKAAIPLLEWLDRQRLTRRAGDQRLPGPGIRPG